MPRACDCRAIHDIASRDPRIMTLCLAAAMLWERLARAALTYGGIIPFAETQRVSILVRASVSEVETHLGTLVRDGLVLRQDDTLVLPELAGLAEARAAFPHGAYPLRIEETEFDWSAEQARQQRRLHGVGRNGLSHPRHQHPRQPARLRSGR